MTGGRRLEHMDEADLQHIANILATELSRPYDAKDPILQCGVDCLATIKSDPRVAQLISYTRLKAYPFKDVPACWRRMYCDAALWHATRKLEACAAAAAAPAEGASAGRTTTVTEKQRRGQRRLQMVRPEFDDAIAMLDMALIMSGAPLREALVHATCDRLHAFLASAAESAPEGQATTAEPAGAGDAAWKRGLSADDGDAAAKASKRRRQRAGSPQPSPPAANLAALTQQLCCPALKHPIPTTRAPSMQAFQSHLSASRTADGRAGPTPLVITDSISHWPALCSRPWSSTAYLLDRTLGGRRHVPVEIGSSYTDARWGQRLMRFSEFVERYMDPEREAVPARERGYLAQHDLLTQMPGLRADVGIPDYCYCEPPAEDKEESTLSEPAINAWLGPAHTVSPLHTDPHHNVLAQVFGRKYVRLYSPAEGDKLRPMQDGVGGVDMSNTSKVDLSQWMRVVEGWDGWNAADGLGQGEDDEAGNETAEELRKKFPDFEGTEYFEAILAPGECLYIPRGWWHYVRSLRPSFSVSFWWD